MKPIEIHIDGIKIVISEDESSKITEEKQDGKITYIPYPVYPTMEQPDWQKYPYITWIGGETTLTNTSDYKIELSPIRDIMVGKVIYEQ